MLSPSTSISRAVEPLTRLLMLLPTWDAEIPAAFALMGSTWISSTGEPSSRLEWILVTSSRSFSVSQILLTTCFTSS